jgi:hypothetical protein
VIEHADEYLVPEVIGAPLPRFVMQLFAPFVRNKVSVI